MRPHWVRRVAIVAVVSAAFGGCGPEATDLGPCENVDFKKRLCGVSSFPEDVCCTAEGCETPPFGDVLDCRLKCWFDAPCDDVRASDPGPDVRECLSDCTSREGQFKCGDGVVIPVSFVCDGTPHCESEADEADCSGSNLGGRFYCDDGTGIPESWRCDGSTDCEDGC